MRRFFAFLLAVLMMLSMAACDTTGEAPAETTPKGETIVYAQNNLRLEDVSDRIRLLGRSEYGDYGVICDQTASGIEFSAYISGKLSLSFNCLQDAYFTVFVDDVRREERLAVKGGIGDQMVEIAEFSEMELHEIRIVKQTEANNAAVTLKQLDFYGYLAPKTAEREIYLEFLGDSITCGYGNLWDKSASDPSNKSGTALYQDGTKSFAYLTAQLLKADVSIVSRSGIGVDRSYTNQNGNGYTMLDYYKASSYVRSTTEQFDFENARVPDVVIINLGTNDQSVGSTEEQFKAGVKELVEFIRSAYQEDVPIVWVYGMMSDGCYQWVQSVFAQMGGENAKLYTCKLVRNKEAGNGHPSLTAHNIASQQLTGFLTSHNLVEV